MSIRAVDRSPALSTWRLALPLPIRVSHHIDNGVTVCDVLDTRKDLHDILPENDSFPVNLVAGDVLDA
jgi:hypothetical protein